MIALLLGLVVVLALALAGIVAALYRISKNVGPLDLEDYATRNDVVYLPVSRKMVDGLQNWSKPIRIRVDAHQHPLLGELVATYNLTDQTPEQADV